MQCPCNSQKYYAQCCEVFHKGVQAPSAETLMRSRYSAFALGLSSYLFATELEKLHKDLTIEDFDVQIKDQIWVNLEVLFASDFEVEFQASLLDDDHLLIHHETSLFVEEDGLKYAKALTQNNTTQKILRNDNCPCGSGKKFKKCKHDKKN
ncbi:MAG: YchJ family metal-binding protein [Thiovulaceae bacterium]|nr:YchJ family metal-binding protein [Sulfurimonadaceae bacterium]